MILGVIFSAYFSACVKYPQITLKNFELESFSIKISQNLFVLHISHLGDSYHFALFDTLGTPVASKILQNGSFSNDKLLPPSNKYDEILFQSLLLLHSGKSHKIAETYEIMKVKND